MPDATALLHPDLGGDDIPIIEVPMPPMHAPHDAASPLPADAAPASVAVADDAATVAHDDSVVPDDGKPDGERDRLVWAMERCGWVQAKAARLLKISPRQMGYALQKNGIEVRKF